MLAISAEQAFHRETITEYDFGRMAQEVFIWRRQLVILAITKNQRAMIGALSVMLNYR